MTEPKLVWNPDNIRDVAESVGISALNEDAVRSLSQDVEYRVGQVIVEAMRFMHQGKRTVLGTQDISQALKVLDVEPLYGYESTRPLRFGEASLGPGQPLFYIEDEEVDFEKLINAPLPKVPRDVAFTAHWLAVEGVQPSIPQNPTTAEARANELVPKGPGANPSLGALAGNENTAFKPLVKHVVSRELILFFDKIKAAILDESLDQDVVILRKSALESVRSDPGLHQLVPYFVQFVAEKVTHSIGNLFVLQQMMELTQAMIENKSLFVDPYVAAVIPPILTCIIGRNIGGEGAAMKDQYQLRDLAVSLIGHITKKFSTASAELQARLARTFLKNFLDPMKTLDVHYGAISGITVIGGPTAISTLILPNLKSYEYVLIKAQNELGPSDDRVTMLIAAIMKGVLSLVATSPEVTTNGTNGTSAEGQLIEDYLGPIIGGRVAALGNHRLNGAVLRSRELP
ncbi:hypothetical protein PZA11_006499 [Diplocarpon coronariae]|uniref:TBP-associated factor 6 n=1 Tax=Diplocarpon coronariae TaxID=2795749 RepID=A0A218ZB78_9HELO|nr:hypothetical protein JHW43_007768 [Diplocarpon mali]OWP05287.1 hypothetical protein B2J93_8029 [Marssonina coronariae]